MKGGGFPARGLRPLRLLPPPGDPCEAFAERRAPAGNELSRAGNAKLLFPISRREDAMTTIAPIRGDCVWRGAEIAASDRWIRPIPPALSAALIEAAKTAKDRGLDWSTPTREHFQVPGLDAFCADVREELENGCGMVKLTGLDFAHLDPALHRHFWYGFGTHLGNIRSQSWSGLLMKAIQDEGYEVASSHGVTVDESGKPFLSSYARTLTAGPLRFHTDRCDVVGLFCVGQAAKGGVSRLASTGAVHNEILKRRPDLLEVLYQPVPRTRFGEEKGGEAQVYFLPIFGQRDGRLTSHYSRTYIENAQQLPQVPRLTPEQVEALALLDSVAGELCYEMVMEPGEIQLLNNHVIYHARTAFENDAATGRVRSMLRLWFAMPNSRALPEDHAVLWGQVAAGAPRGGIAVAA
jgi:Taurine catabolism dioxygenase TauD, TfdA family